MKRFLVLVATITVACAITAPAASAATNSAKIGSYDCSVYAQTPSVGSGPYVNANGWASCGTQNYSKRVDVQLWQLVAGGWQFVTDGGWSGWTFADPIGENVGQSPCVSGRWYATKAYGEVGSSEASASTFAAGAQCP